jgi:mitochondrial cardiolipin hydrolase
MNTDELNQFLARAFADRKLSGSERAALADWLSQHVRTDQHRGLARHAAFEIARSAPPSSDVVDWLEAVMKVLAPLAQSGAVAAPVADEVLFAPGDACRQRIVSRFAACRRTADVCVFTVTDDRISKAILDAHARGVRVRIITDNEKQHDAGSDVARLRAAGIAVKVDNMTEAAEPGTNGHMHHKFAVFDGARVLNGSYNWTRGAGDLNFENVVDSADAVLVKAFAAEFERLWARF